MLKIILLLLIFVNSYLLVRYFYIKMQLEKYKNKSNNFFQTKEIQFKNFISKNNFIKTKEIFLSKQGYPFNLDVIRYFFIKTILFLLFFISGYKNYNSFFYATLFGIIGYFLIDLIIYFHKKNRNDEICIDILNVIQSVCLQLSAHMDLKNSLRLQYCNCKNKDFKKAMLEFSTCYELSEFDMDYSIKNLSEKFQILELDMFCNALSEFNKSGNIIEILENLEDSLNKKQLEKMKNNTKSKIAYITIGVIIALGNIVLLVFYPLFVSLGQGFQNIFK